MIFRRYGLVCLGSSIRTSPKTPELTRFAKYLQPGSGAKVAKRDEVRAWGTDRVAQDLVCFV